MPAEIADVCGLEEAEIKLGQAFVIQAAQVFESPLDL